jgi:hypothetical protein
MGWWWWWWWWWRRRQWWWRWWWFQMMIPNDDSKWWFQMMIPNDSNIDLHLLGINMWLNHHPTSLDTNWRNFIHSAWRHIDDREMFEHLQETSRYIPIHPILFAIFPHQNHSTYRFSCDFSLQPRSEALHWRRLQRTCVP